MLTCKTFKAFLYWDPECTMYGPCCKHVVYKLSKVAIEAYKIIQKCLHFVQFIEDNTYNRHTYRTVCDVLNFSNKGLLKYLKGVKSLVFGDVNGILDDDDLSNLSGVEQLALVNADGIKGNGFRYIESVKYLNISGFCNANKGLKYLKNLVQLQLRNCLDITDDDLGMVNKDIKELSIYDNDEFTGTCLKNLVSLKKIDIGDCDSFIDKNLIYISNVKVAIFSTIENVSDNELKYLKNVEVLSIAWNEKFTGSSLVYLKKLNDICLFECSAFVNDSLMHISNVPLIDIYACRQLDDSGFKFLKNVRKLDLSYYKKITGTGFVNLKGLYDVNLHECHSIVDESLKYLNNLHRLNMCNSITDEGLKYITSCYDLDVSNNDYINGSGFVNLKNNHILHLDHCPNIEDESLKYFKNVHDLNLYECRVSDIGIGYLTNVVNLNIGGNDDYIIGTSLCKLKKLEYLNVIASNIKSQYLLPLKSYVKKIEGWRADDY